MLKSISEAKLQSPVVLFVGHSTESPATRSFICDPLHPLPDTADRNGSSLFLNIIQSLIGASDRVTHVLCWQRSTLKHLQALQKEDPSKLHLHNCFSDFHGWINPECKESGMFSMIWKSIPEGTKDVNVVIDSLSNPLFTIGFGPCVQEIQEVVNSTAERGPKIHQLLCLVHSEVLPCGPSSLLYLKHVASTVVELKSQVARITHRKPGGHVERKEEKYTIMPEGQISIQPFRTSAFTELKHVEDKQPTLPQDVASFRVGLSEKEKDDRNKLVLPYMRNNDKPDGGGKVFYQPDAVDDWDDEDPDDDLDI